MTLNGQPLLLNKDFSPSPSYMAAGSWSTDSIVFASFGIKDSITSDYKNLSLKNKWIMIIRGNEKDVNKPDSQALYSRRNPASSTFKIRTLKAEGAAAILIVVNEVPKTKIPFAGNMYVSDEGKAIPVIYITYSLAASLLGGHAASLAEMKNFAKGNYAAHCTLEQTTFTIHMESSDIIGVLPGTDKKDEYVFVTGHYDHLGKKDSVIYYGADDDGSGTTSVLQIATAFAKAKKKKDLHPAEQWCL